jgi:hypothetical protein
MPRYTGALVSRRRQPRRGVIVVLSRRVRRGQCLVKFAFTQPRPNLDISSRSPRPLPHLGNRSAWLDHRVSTTVPSCRQAKRTPPPGLVVIRRNPINLVIDLIAGGADEHPT